MVLEEARSEPRSRQLPQSDAGGSRDGTTAKEPVVTRRKEATRIRGPREEHTQQQGKIKRTERAWPAAGKSRALPTADESRAQTTAGQKSIEDLEEDG